MNDIENIRQYVLRLFRGKTIWYLAIFLLALKMALIIVVIHFPQNIFFADITKSSLEMLVNRTRENIGLNPLTENSNLNQAARLKAENMIQNNYFSHKSPSGVSPWYWFLQAGYKYKYAGENLAVGFFESEEVYNAWLNSADHRANIVNPNYTEFGTAVLNGFGGNNTVIVVQEFGSRATPVKQKVASNNSIADKPIESPVVSNTENVEATIEEEPGQQVLSQSTGPQISQTSQGKDSLALRVLNFVMYDYYALIQNLIYGFSLVLSGVLIMLVLFYPRRELILRAVVIILILFTATILDKEAIISLIPHEIII